MFLSHQENQNFFMNNPQMGLSPAQFTHLSTEGLSTVESFINFEENDLDSAARNLRFAIPGIPAVLVPVDAAIEVVPTVAAVTACTMPASCLKHLKIASIAYHYYISIGREPTSVNMNFSRVEWEAIKKLLCLTLVRPPWSSSCTFTS